MAPGNNNNNNNNKNTEPNLSERMISIALTQSISWKPITIVDNVNIYQEAQNSFQQLISL